MKLWRMLAVVLFFLLPLTVQAGPATPVPEGRSWYSAVPLSDVFVSPLSPPLYGPVLRASAAGLAAMPEVYDTVGLPHDWTWLISHFGDVTYKPSAAPAKFALRRIDATVGPATIVVRVLASNGLPAYNQPVFLSWPGIDCSQPDPNIKPIDSLYKTRLSNCGIMQRTDSNGYTGFGMSGDWYYRGGSAPGIVWVGSPSLESDGVDDIGMLGGTVHECPCALTYQEVVASTATPTPVPTITPTPGGDDVADILAELRQLRADFAAFVARWGAAR